MPQIKLRTIMIGIVLYALALAALRQVSHWPTRLLVLRAVVLPVAIAAVYVPLIGAVPRRQERWLILAFALPLGALLLLIASDEEAVRNQPFFDLPAMPAFLTLFTIFFAYLYRLRRRDRLEKRGLS